MPCSYPAGSCGGGGDGVLSDSINIYSHQHFRRNVSSSSALPIRFISRESLEEKQ